jgi:hypothetical protein
MLNYSAREIVAEAMRVMLLALSLMVENSVAASERQFPF